MLDKDIHLVDNNYTQTEKRNYIMAIDAGLLASLDEVFAEVSENPASNEFKELDNGTYTGVFVEVELTESKKGDPMVVINTKLDEPNQNKKLYYWLGSPEMLSRNMSEVKRIIFALGAPQELSFTELLKWANEEAVEHAIELEVTSYIPKKGKNAGVEQKNLKLNPVDEIALEDEEDDLFGGSDLTDEEDEDNIFGE